MCVCVFVCVCVFDCSCVADIMYVSAAARLQIACTFASGKYCPPSSSTATGVQCPVGYYCTSMAAAPTQCGAGYYCPAGAAAALQCAQGYYGAALVPTYTTNQCSGACTFTSGSYCPAASSTPGGIPCAAGSYCTSMSASTTCKCVRVCVLVFCSSGVARIMLTCPLAQHRRDVVSGGDCCG
jgi:hypothetical protein